MLAWSSVIASHWVPPNREILRFYAQTAAAAIAPESPLVFLLAHLNNVLAGVAEVALSETKAAGLYNVMTLPAHRYRGVASALVEAAIEVAQRRGMQTLELQSTPAAFRIYASRGFQHEGDWRLKVGNHGVEAAARSGRGAA
jgi:GNAT superfamily N-acetyltransferase